MPVTKQAIKKVRQDKRKVAYNLRAKKSYKEAVKKYLKSPTVAGLKTVYKSVDKAAKTNLIHKNKAARIKSRLSKKLSKGKSELKSKTPSKPAKKSSKS